MLYMEDKVTNKHMNDIDPNTYEMVFKEFYAPLTIYAHTIVKDRDESEDIVQSVFADLWSQRSKLKIHTSLKAFLYKAVYFKSLNHIKHKKVVTRHELSVDKNVSLDYDPALESELSHKIKTTIEGLPPQCQKIFIMSRHQGLKYKEIAQKLELSQKTIEHQMGKALRVLRSELKEYLPVLFLLQLIY